MAINSAPEQLKAMRNKTPLLHVVYPVNTWFFTDARVGGCRYTNNYTVGKAGVSAHAPKMCY